jgi:hypothetical protein
MSKKRGIVEVAQEMAEMTKSIEKYTVKMKEFQRAKKSCEVELEKLKAEVREFSQAGSSAAGNPKRAQCAFSTGESDLPCTFELACRECCSDLVSARMQRNQANKEWKVKAPLSAETAAAANMVVALVNAKTKGDDTENDEDDEDVHSDDDRADKCGLSESTRENKCFSEESWEEYVKDKFRDWKNDFWDFLDLSALSEEAQNKLKTCTLGVFSQTIVPNVDLWWKEDAKDMKKWSDRLAQEFKWI